MQAWSGDELVRHQRGAVRCLAVPCCALLYFAHATEPRDEGEMRPAPLPSRRAVGAWGSAAMGAARLVLFFGGGAAGRDADSSVGVGVWV